jgi:large subunit ribosomal protein L1
LTITFKKIKDGWTDVDVIITMPAVMGKLGPLGRILDLEV